MIPPWREALAHSIALLGPRGSLHIVDFGDQAGLPDWFRALLFRWLDWFHVSPRLELRNELMRVAGSADLGLRFAELYRGYAFFATLERSASC